MSERQEQPPVATPCRCGLRWCRSGWPADAPPPAELPEPLRWLAGQRAVTHG